MLTDLVPLMDVPMLFKELGYILSDFNIIGWRSRNGRVNHFDDFISVVVRSEDIFKEAVWEATTRPGSPWLRTPITERGAAILVPGQYLNAYCLGVYKGYECLRQFGPLSVYRDNDRDEDFDAQIDTIETGYFGIHIHKAGLLSNFVGTWSAGCQVFRRKDDFESFIEICKRSNKNYFTYTLLEF